jgi:multidrug efflux pump subunit AcrB
LSLFGLVLAIGIVVDDAIVVVENVERNIEEGLTPREATYRAMREVSGPIIAIALVLVAVFVPLAFISGAHLLPAQRGPGHPAGQRAACRPGPRRRARGT